MAVQAYDRDMQTQSTAQIGAAFDHQVKLERADGDRKGRKATVAWVILTQGNRKNSLLRAIQSIEKQTVAPDEIVVVFNGAEPDDLENNVIVLNIATNIGIPAARNIGVENTSSEIIFFLDDDAFCVDPELTSRSLELFLGNATLGVLAFRIVDPGTGETPRRYVPRLRAGSPARSSEVTHFLGGACAIRRSTFEPVGGYPDMFFYAHEEIDLAWKALDKGFHLAYRGDLRIAHPTTRPSRHPDYYFFTTRNRVFVARRRLPLVVAFSYVLTWSAITLVRARRPRDIRQILRGLAAGVRAPCGGRRPMSWATIWCMARLGRPPII